MALGGAVVLALFQRSRRFPAALVLLAAGVALGLGAHYRNLPSPPGAGWGPMSLQLLHPKAEELWRVVPLLVIPQFALTFGNSIVATESTAQILYGPQARRVTVRGLSLSLGLVNLVSALMMGSPLCHGSGGITAHYRFGARTPKASYVIGSVCLLLALFGRAAVGLVNLIPTAVLGIFLVYVGVQHAAYVRDIVKRVPLLFIAASVGVVSLATTNLMWGFLVGFALQAMLSVFVKAPDRGL
jgi:SulP family sulfate permease